MAKSKNTIIFDETEYPLSDCITRSVVDEVDCTVYDKTDMSVVYNSVLDSKLCERDLRKVLSKDGIECPKDIVISWTPTIVRYAMPLDFFTAHAAIITD